MKIKSLVTMTILLTSTIWSQAQQINAVPDYVFRNQMSVGRNAVTDTAAYFSIGPRYGATKGFMPPIVGDTATFSSGKRNGLLIFSVQKNKFLYWDSVRVQWSDMAGGSGSYILAGDTSAMLAPYLRKSDTTAMLSPYYRSATASAALALKLNISDTSSMLANYIRHAGYGLTKSGQSFLVDTLNIATRAWRQKGIDSVVSIIPAAGVGGSGTTNYVPKFTAGSTIGNSLIQDNGTGVGIGGSQLDRLTIFQDQNATTTARVRNSDIGSSAYSQFVVNASGNSWGFRMGSSAANSNALDIVSDALGTPGSRLRITSGGDVGIGTTSPSAKLHIQGSEIRIQDNNSNINFRNAAGTRTGYIQSRADAFDIWNDQAVPMVFGTNNTERLRIFANGRVFIGASPTDAGYQLDINGTLRSVNGANFATTSGNVGIGTASPAQKLDVSGITRVNGGTIYAQASGTESSGYQLNAITLGYDATNAVGWITAGGAAARTNLVLQEGSGGELLIGTKTDAGDYKLQVSGNIYNTGSAVLAATSGNVGVGTTPSTWTGFGAPVIEMPSGGTVIGQGSVTLGSGFYYSAPNLLYKSTGVLPSYMLQVGGTFRFYTAPSGTAGNAITFTQAMTLNEASELLVNTTTDAGDYKLQVAGNIYTTGNIQMTGSAAIRNTVSQFIDYGTGGSGDLYIRGGSGFANVMTATNAGEVLFNTTTDAGDYKLQVVGNARIGTGKLDIASNTTFGIGVARSGTSEVAGQIYNSNGILYLGAESSAGGQIFSGSSAYAAVIGSGANYPLQFAANNITRATLTTNGNFMVGFPTDTYFYRLQVNGSIFSNNQIIAQNAAAQLNIDSSTNISPLYISNQSLTGSSAQGLFYGSTTWNTTGNPSLIDLAITNTASGSDANYIKISDGSNIFRVTKAAEVVTAAPTGGSIRKWKLGEAATVSPTSPNRTIRVEIDGTVYYLHAKTTND